MAITSGELERSFINSVSGITGKTLEAWLAIMESSGINERTDMLVWLKKYYGLPHLYAQLISGIYLNGGYPVYVDEHRLLEKHFSGCPVMQKVFESISTGILSAFPGAQIIPKNEYLSFTAIREFAIVKITPREVRMGLDLGSGSYLAPVMPSAIKGSPKGFTYMLVIRKTSQFDEEVLTLISKSYKRIHKNEKY